MPAEIHDPEQRLERIRTYEYLLESQIACFEMAVENFDGMNEIQVLANGAKFPTAAYISSIATFREQLEWCRKELAGAN